MARFLHEEISAIQARRNSIFLAIVFLFGLLLGFYFFFYAESFIFSLMRSRVIKAVSIVDAVLILLFPLFLSAIAIFFQSHWLIYIVSFFKAFSFSYIGSGFYAVYGCSAWLIRLSMTLCDIFFLPFLYYFWHTGLCKGSRDFGKRFCFLMMTACLLSYFEIHHFIPLWDYI